MAGRAREESETVQVLSSMYNNPIRRPEENGRPGRNTLIWFHGIFFFFSSRRRHTRWTGDWSSDVCSSDLNCDIPTWRAKGLNDWSSNGSTTPVNVSGGIGTSRFAPVRIACKPEAVLLTLRSEERRVGKECRSRGSPLP